jgi:RimJ/RimL family protein N-acetyltransferase
LVELHVRDISQGGLVSSRAIVMQRKTHRPVQFELTEPTREAVAAWLSKAQLKPEQFLFPSRIHASPHLSTRQYAKIVEHWVTSIGLDPNVDAAHQSHFDLPQNQKYPGSPASARPPEVGEHGEISWYRGR